MCFPKGDSYDETTVSVWWRPLRSPWLAASSSPRRWPADTDTEVTVTVYRVLGSGFRGYWYWYGAAPASRATCRSTSTQTHQAALTFRFESDPSTHFNCRCQKRCVFLLLRETPLNIVPDDVWPSDSAHSRENQILNLDDIFHFPAGLECATRHRTWYYWYGHSMLY